MVNAVSPVLFAQAFAKQMIANNHGTIAIIGSVAGDRGRKMNYVYGAAKGLVSRYAQGMQHRLANTSVKVVLIKPGPTDTPMTSNLKAKGQKLASVEQVAQDIVKGVATGKPVVYTPSIWKIIMLVAMHLPRVIFNKLSI
jgi:short-subunit dehydrogenase